MMTSSQRRSGSLQETNSKADLMAMEQRRWSPEAGKDVWEGVWERGRTAHRYTAVATQQENLQTACDHAG